MTLKEIEKDMKEFTGGSSFIRIGQLASYLGQKNTNRVREKYTKDAFKLDNSPSYFIPDVAKNIFRAGLIVILLLFSSVSAEAEEIDFKGQGFEVLYATAYCMGETTANGSKVHVGGCACNPHLGEVAIVYTLDGDFLGQYEVNDVGGTDGLKNGTVIDFYRPNLTMCQSLMRIFYNSDPSGRVYVKFIDGKG